jgi:FkbM family methyltransferase
MRKPFVDIVEPRDQGVRLQIDPRDPFQLEIWLGAYQPHVVSFLRKAVHPNAIVLCAGLHVGYIAALSRALAGPRGRVLSAEPDAEARQLALRNLARQSGVAPITVFEGGLSDEPCTLTLHRSSVLGHSSFGAEHHPLDEYVVPVIPGDSWLAQVGVPELDVLVLDVEGWEFRVLRGLRSTLVNSRSMVALVEVSEWALRAAGTSGAEVIDWLRGLGFEARWATQYGDHLPLGTWGPPVRHPAEALSSDVLCLRP